MNPFTFDATDRAIATSEAWTVARYNRQIENLRHLQWGLDQRFTTGQQSYSTSLGMVRLERGLVDLSGRRSLVSRAINDFSDCGMPTKTGQLNLLHRAFGRSSLIGQPNIPLYSQNCATPGGEMDSVRLPSRLVIANQIFDRASDRLRRLLQGGTAFFYGSMPATSGSGLAEFVVDNVTIPNASVVGEETDDYYRHDRTGIIPGDYWSFRHAAVSGGVLRFGIVTRVDVDPFGKISNILLTELEPVASSPAIIFAGVSTNYLKIFRGHTVFNNCTFLAPVTADSALFTFNNCTFIKRRRADEESDDPRFCNGRVDGSRLPGWNEGSENHNAGIALRVMLHNCDFIVEENNEDLEPFFHIMCGNPRGWTFKGCRYFQMASFTLAEPGELNGRFLDVVSRSSNSQEGLMLWCQLRHFNQDMQIGGAGTGDDYKTMTTLLRSRLSNNLRVLAGITTLFP